MTKVLRCSTCGYGLLSAGCDPQGIFLGILQNIHKTTFPDHDVVVRGADSEDILQFTHKHRYDQK